MQQLLGGQAPPAVNTYAQNLTSVPTWMMNDVNSYLAQAQSVAGQPYQSFPGPQVAPWTPDQVQAQQQVENMQGGYQPYMSAATGATANALNPMSFNAAEAFLPGATSAIYGGMMPSQAMMNPYIGNVIGQAEDQAMQMWGNQIMPSINNQFVAAGQPQSSGNMSALAQAGKQVTQNIQDTAGAALASGYQQAQQAGLSGGQALGNLSQLQGGLGYEQGILGLQGAGSYGNLGQLGQSLGLTGAGALYNMGQQQQQQGQQNLNTAYQNWYNQTQYPQSQLQFVSGLTAGSASPYTTGAATTTANAGYLPGSTYGPSPLNASLGMYTGMNAPMGTPYPGSSIAPYMGTGAPNPMVSGSYNPYSTSNYQTANTMGGGMYYT